MTAQGKISKADQHVSEISKNFMAPGYSLCLFKLSLQVHTWALLNSMLGFHCSVQRVFDQTNLCLLTLICLCLCKITATGLKWSCAFINNRNAMCFINTFDFRNLDKKPDYSMSKTEAQMPSHAGLSPRSESIKNFWMQIKKPLGSVAHLYSNQKH